MADFTIDPEFRDLIPALSPEEFDQLKKNVIGQGIQSPLITATVSGEETLIDGHNRHAICTKYGIEFTTISLGIMSREAVIEWIIRNQLGRRNLTPFQRAEMALRLEPVIQEKARENLRASGGDKTEAGLTTLSNPVEPVNTRAEIAKAADLSEGTVAKVKTILESGDKGLIDSVRAGEVSINKASQQVRSGPPDLNDPRRPQQKSEPKPYDIEADSRKFRELRDRLYDNWTTEEHKAVMRQTFRQLANEV